MSEAHSGVAGNKRVGGKRRGGKGRTLTDTLLISVWVAGYSVVLGVYRITKALESIF
jgi:hypothetical protein